MPDDHGTTIPGVQEILLLHSARTEAELLRRRPDGSRPEQPAVITGAGALTLASSDCVLPLATPYRATTLATG